MQLVDEFKALLSRYSAHSPSTETQSRRRNVICVPVSASGSTLYDTNLVLEEVLRAISAEFGTDVPVVPDQRVTTDETDQIRQLLGNEFSVLVIDATLDWPDNVLGAACGAVKTPGLLILLLPNGTHLSSTSSPYEQHLKNGLRRYLTPCSAMPACSSLHPIPSSLPQTHNSQSAPPAEQLTQLNTSKPLDTNNPPLSWEVEQQALLQSILARGTESGKTLDLILARRGRGKSALLGQLIDYHLRASPVEPATSITLTASHPNQVIPVIKHVNQGTVAFTPLDKALQTRGSLLFVDEAGSIPVPVLRQLTERYQHTVMAGTVDGYEGSGRALRLVFSSSVSPTIPSPIAIHHHTLSCPVRWPVGDELEAMCDELLCLDSASSPLPEARQTPYLDDDVIKQIKHQRVSSEQLLNDNTLLTSVFGLLLDAHYQTSSRDLKHLLDQKKLTVFTQTLHGKVTAASLIAHEGGLPQSDVDGVINNTRRPAHQRLPVLLYQQCRTTPILHASHWRVIRIAVQPALQHRGLGTRLLNYIKDAANHSSQLDAPDVIGASFGATQRGLNFWQQAGYQPMQWGFRLNPRSGQRAVTVALATATSSKAGACLAQANAHLLDTLDALKTLKQVQPDWVKILYGDKPFDAATLNQFTHSGTGLKPGADRQLSDATQRQRDSQRIELWRQGRSQLHETWGPIVRRAGGADAIATWQFPGAKNVKQLTQQIQQRLT